MTLQPHQQRVVQEKAELDEKIARLSTFIHGHDTYKQLDTEEQIRLNCQLAMMNGYSNILGERIEAFTSSDFAPGKACDLSGEGTCESCQ